MFKQRNRRSGFTLPEVLVTVAIVAVLAAMVVPAVTQQISKGDDSNLVGGVQSLRTAVTSFVADTRQTPGKIEDLFTRPADTDLNAYGNAYGAAAVAKWNGPYNVGSYTAADGIDFTVGTVEDSVIALAALDATDYPLVTTNVFTVFITVAGEARRLHADSLLDKGNGSAAGDVRWTVAPGDTTLVVRLLPAR